jgi:hypothetical protein
LDGVSRRLLALGFAAAGPDQRATGVEKVRVDRLDEGGIVEFDREAVAAFVGALRPGGAVVAIGFGRDAQFLACMARVAI